MIAYIAKSVLLAALILVSFCSASDWTQEFNDGGVYKLFSSTDGNALSVSSQGMVEEGTQITVMPYQHMDNQKWVALQTKGGGSFILIPKQQHWTWDQTSLTNGIMSLPSYSMAMGVDPSGNIVQQLIDGSKPQDYQKWKAIVAGEKHILLENKNKEMCLKNPGSTAGVQQESMFTQGVHKMDNIFGIHHKHREMGSVTLLLVSCDQTDETQKWKLEMANLD